MQTEEFMESIILQMGKFFQQLAIYCEENAEALASSSKKTSKKSNKSKRSKRKKKKRADPDKPKKPLTPFFIYFMQKRDQVKQENPNFSATEITETLGRQWRALNKESKEVYQKQFNHNFDKYKIELAEYYKRKNIDPKTGKKIGGIEDQSSATLGKRPTSTQNENTSETADITEDVDEEDGKSDVSL